MSNLNWEDIKKEFERCQKGLCIICGCEHNAMGWSKGIKENPDGSYETYTHEEKIVEPIVYVAQLLSQSRSQTIEEIKGNFINRFCNDHNADKDGNGIRWLRSVALNEQDLLDDILEFLKEPLNSLK